MVTRFHGTSVHDGLQSYQGYFFPHALCNVHHLRELTFIQEQFEQRWAGELKELLLEMQGIVEQAKAHGHAAVDELTRARLRSRYEALVAGGYW